MPGAAARLGSIAERVALYDGRLEIEDREDQTLSCRCRLPLGAAVTA